MAPDPRRWSLARQFSALLALALAAVVCAGVIAAYVQARSATLGSARSEVLAVAQSVAQSPSVRTALAGPDPAAALQPYAEQVRRSTGTDFVVVMSPAGIRYSHPNSSLIGGRFVGNTAPATLGRPFTEIYTGTLGPSVRAVVPVFGDGSGSTGSGSTGSGTRVVGLVAVGITLDTVGAAMLRQLPWLVGAGLVALALCGVWAWLLSRRLRRQTHDLGSAELTRLFEFYDAVLHAVREGLLLLDRGGRLQLANDEARRLLALPDGAIGLPVGEVGLPRALAEALAAGQDLTDELHLTGERVVVVNQATARWKGRVLGTVVTLRDRTDLIALTGELDSVRGLTESLRSQAHEAANRLHAVVSLIELGRTEHALEFATAELASAQQLTDRVVGAVREPVLAALLLGKAAQGSERGIELELDDDLDVPEGLIDPRDLVTIVGNLLDNALDAAASGPAPRRVAFCATLLTDGENAGGGAQLVVRVSDSGSGLAESDVEQAFTRDWSTKPADGSNRRGLGLALVAQVVGRHGGTIDVRGGVPSPDPADAHHERLPGAAFTVSLPGAAFTVSLPVRQPEAART